MKSVRSESNPAKNQERESDTNSENPESYKIVKGDTLSAIAKRFYGDPSLAYKLATANGIKNPNLIYPGDILELPHAEELGRYQATISGSRSGAKVFDPGVQSDPFVQSAWDFS